MKVALLVTNNIQCVEYHSNNELKMRATVHVCHLYKHAVSSRAFINANFR